MEKPEHIVRMEDEMSELDDRILLADTFLHDEGQKILNRTQTHLRHIQLDAMRSYRRVLAIRIEHDMQVIEDEAAESERVADIEAGRFFQGSGDADSEQS